MRGKVVKTEKSYRSFMTAITASGNGIPFPRSVRACMCVCACVCVDIHVSEFVCLSVCVHVRLCVVLRSSTCTAKLGQITPADLHGAAYLVRHRLLLFGRITYPLTFAFLHVRHDRRVSRCLRQAYDSAI